MKDENYYHISVVINIFNLRLHLSFPQIKSMVGVPYLEKDCMKKDLLLRINEQAFKIIIIYRLQTCR